MHFGFVYLFVLIFCLFISLYSRFYCPTPRPPSDYSTSHTSSLDHLHKDVTTSHPLPNQTLNFLGPSVSWGLGASSLTEPRPSVSPLLYVYVLGASYQLAYAAWLCSSIWEILGVQVNWDCWSSYRVPLLLSFFQLSPNSTTASVHWLGANICDSAACWVFQKAVMIGPFLWALVASIIVSGLGASPFAGSHFDFLFFW